MKDCPALVHGILTLACPDPEDNVTWCTHPLIDTLKQYYPILEERGLLKQSNIQKYLPEAGYPLFKKLINQTAEWPIISTSDESDAVAMIAKARTSLEEKGRHHGYNDDASVEDSDSVNKNKHLRPPGRATRSIPSSRSGMPSSPGLSSGSGAPVSSRTDSSVVKETSGSKQFSYSQTPEDSEGTNGSALPPLGSGRRDCPTPLPSDRAINSSTRNMCTVIRNGLKLRYKEYFQILLREMSQFRQDPPIEKTCGLLLLLTTSDALTTKEVWEVYNNSSAEGDPLTQEQGRFLAERLWRRVL